MLFRVRGEAEFGARSRFARVFTLFALPGRPMYAFLRGVLRPGARICAFLRGVLRPGARICAFLPGVQWLEDPTPSMYPQGPGNPGRLHRHCSQGSAASHNKFSGQSVKRAVRQGGLPAKAAQPTWDLLTHKPSVSTPARGFTGIHNII